MINPVPVELTSSSAEGPKKKDSPEAIENAASQFEALMIGQLLKAARSEGDAGWLGTDSDEAGSTLTEMSEQALSSSLAAGGGLGLSKMIAAGLQHTANQLHPPSKKED